MTAHVRERQADAVRGLIDRDRVGPGRPVRAELGERSVPLLEHGRDSTQSLTRTGRAPPDGKQAGTLIPPAFGLAGLNLHTWTGFGSVTYSNAYAGATEMHGSGTFFDARLSNRDQYPVAARSGSGNTRGVPDRLPAKLAAPAFPSTVNPRTEAALPSLKRSVGRALQVVRGLREFTSSVKRAEP